MKKRVHESDDYGCVVAFDTRQRTIYLMGDVCLRMYQQFMEALAKLTHSQGAITIKINSSGGDITQAFAIYDEIRLLSNTHVKTIAVGECYSGAAVILQAGDLRLATANTGIMVHKGSFGLSEEQADENYALVKFYRKLDTLHKNILCETDAGALGIAKYYTAPEALKDKLIDGIIE